MRRSFKIVEDPNLPMSLYHKTGLNIIISDDIKKKKVRNQPSLHSTEGVSAWKWGLMPGGKDLGRVVSSPPCEGKPMFYISWMPKQRHLNRVKAVYQILFSVK